MAQQTAVEWLSEKLNEFNGEDNPWFDIPLSILEQAKEMEYNQIVNAYLQKRAKGNIVKCLKTWDLADEYYNKTYKNDTQTTL
jgi:hypothetical protein